MRTALAHWPSCRIGRHVSQQERLTLAELHASGKHLSRSLNKLLETCMLHLLHHSGCRERRGCHGDVAGGTQALASRVAGAHWALLRDECTFDGHATGLGCCLLAKIWAVCARVDIAQDWRPQRVCEYCGKKNPRCCCEHSARPQCRSGQRHLDLLSVTALALSLDAP